jgi:hypothetical protein
MCLFLDVEVYYCIVSNLVFFLKVLIQQQIMYIRSKFKHLKLWWKTETVISKVLEISKRCRDRRKVEPS